VTTVSRVTAALQAPAFGIDLPCSDVDLVIDETWSPRQQATVTVPASPLLDYLDPRGVQDVHLVLTSEALAGFAVADLTGLVGGSTADLTGRLGGGPVAGLTAALLGSITTPRWRAPVRLDVALHVREMVVDHAAGTAGLRLASDEAFAQESIGQDLTRETFDTFAARVEWLFSEIVGLSSRAGWDMGALAGTLLSPRRGSGLTETAWAVLEEAAGTLGLRIGVDVDGVWRVWDTTAAPASTLHLSRAVSVRETIDRDSDWADRVVAVATAHTSLGADTSLHYDSPPLDPWPNSHPRKTEVHEWDLGEASNPLWPVQPARIAARAVSEGRTLDIVAPIDLRLRPGVGLVLDPPLPARTAVCAVVRFHLAADPPTAQMMITTRSTARRT
jgi:hypothetical protein